MQFQAVKEKSERVIKLNLDERSWPYSRKAFECELCTHTGKTSNKNAISNKYNVMIGRFWSASTILVMEKLMRLEVGRKI